VLKEVDLWQTSKRLIQCLAILLNIHNWWNTDGWHFSISLRSFLSLTWAPLQLQQHQYPVIMLVLTSFTIFFFMTLAEKNTHPKLSACSSVAKLCIYRSNTHKYTVENIRHFQMKDALDEKKRRQKRRRQKLPVHRTWIIPRAGTNFEFHTTQSTREKGFDTSKELTTRLRHKEIAYKEKIPELSKQRLLITQGIKHICLSLPCENRPGDANP
jgi:hypothetical protein